MLVDLLNFILENAKLWHIGVALCVVAFVYDLLKPINTQSHLNEHD